MSPTDGTKPPVQSRFAEPEIQAEQRYDLSNHMHWMTAGKPGGHGKYNAVFSPATLAAYAEDLKRKFLCDTLVATVRKAP